MLTDLQDSFSKPDIINVSRVGVVANLHTFFPAFGCRCRFLFLLILATGESLSDGGALRSDSESDSKSVGSSESGSDSGNSLNHFSKTGGQNLS